MKQGKKSSPAAPVTVPTTPQRHRKFDPLKVLEACRWPDRVGIEPEQWRIEEITCSHRLIRVTAHDEQEVIIKHRAAETTQEGRSLRNELFIYRLAGWMPAIAAIIPKPIFLDEQHEVIVLESLTTAGKSLSAQTQAQAFLSEHGVANAAGAALATLHSATHSMGMWPSLAVGILGLTTSLDEALAGRAETTQRLMRDIALNATLRPSIQEGFTTYRHECVIHGDLKPANWLISPKQGECGFRLIDWEMSGSGDPYWDIGSLVAEVTIEQINCHQDADTCWTHQSHLAIGTLLRSYTGNYSFNTTTDWRKIAVMAIARLLHVATECTEKGVSPHEWPVRQYFNTAEAMASSLDAMAMILQQCHGHAS